MFAAGLRKIFLQEMSRPPLSRGRRRRPYFRSARRCDTSWLVLESAVSSSWSVYPMTRFNWVVPTRLWRPFDLQVTSRDGDR